MKMRRAGVALSVCILVVNLAGWVAPAASPAGAQQPGGTPVLSLKQILGNREDVALRRCREVVYSAVLPVGQGIVAQACFSRNGVMGPVGDRVTFQVFGVGRINGCGGGFGQGTIDLLVDRDGDGVNEMCQVSGGNFPSVGVGSDRAGQTRILFCADADRDGCLDEPSIAQVGVGWTSGAVTTTTTTRPPTTTTTLRVTTTTTRPPMTTTTLRVTTTTIRPPTTTTIPF